MSENPTVSVVVSSYGRFNCIQKLVESVRQVFPTSTYEIVAVCSDDPSTEKVKWLQQQADVKFIQGDVRTTVRLKSLYHYENCGIKAASGEWIFVTNDDTEFVPGFYDHLLGMQDDYDSILVRGHVGEVGLGCRIPTIGTLTKPNQPEQPLYLYDFSIIRRWVYEKIGYLDENVDWYGKGWDLSLAVEFLAEARTSNSSEMTVQHAIVPENRTSHHAGRDFGYIRQT